MEAKKTIHVDTFYANRAYYPFIPRVVFDALEAAYLEGKGTADVSEADYSAMMSNLKAARLCPGQS